MLPNNECNIMIMAENISMLSITHASMQVESPIISTFTNFPIMHNSEVAYTILQIGIYI